MKRIVFICTVFLIFFLSGCYSYQDINRVYFSTMSIVDINKENGNVVLYEEYFTSDRGVTEQGGLISKVVLKAEGKSHYNAFSNLQSTATYPIRYDVTRAIGFTEHMAKSGIEEELGPLERDQNVTNKVFLFVTEVEPDELLNVEMGDDKFLGIWLEDLFIFQENQAKILSIRASTFLNQRVKGSRISVLPIIGIRKNPLENRLYISGAAVMEEYKMVDRLRADEIPIYKLLHDSADNLIGSFDTIYPIDGAKVTMLPIKIKVKDRIETVDNELTLIYDIKINCSIRAIQGKLNLLDSRVRDKVVKSAEETINTRCEDLYKSFQKKGIDILDVQRKLKEKFRNFDKETINKNTFKDVKLIVNTKVIIDGSQNVSFSIK